MKNKLTQFTKYFVDCMLIGGSLILLSLPFLFRYIGTWYPTFSTYYWEMVALFGAAGIFTIAIVWELHKLLNSVISGNPFIKENEASLKKMSIYGFLIAFITSLRLFLVITPATFVIVIVFGIAGLFSMVLAQVFHEAIYYKEENDLTI